MTEVKHAQHKLTREDSHGILYAVYGIGGRGRGDGVAYMTEMLHSVRSLTAFPEHSRLGVALAVNVDPSHLDMGISQELTGLGVRIMHIDVPGVRLEGSVHFGFKLQAMLRSPFTHTIFLDADTMACAPVTGLFDMLNRFDFVATQVRSISNVSHELLYS